MKNIWAVEYYDEEDHRWYQWAVKSTRNKARISARSCVHPTRIVKFIRAE